ncbi:MAG: sulfur oxidation c-type cytochrome SoxX [Gammaproteobacteria bacterium]|nr:sulfur oxidation c-type cytochrome SoxX [Gammaproteobacteria bacterium]
MQQSRWLWLCYLCAAILPFSSVHAAEPSTPPSNYVKWTVKDFAIDEPLGGLKGDPRRGRAIAGDQHRGNCLACHLLPIPEEEFFGNLGPPLIGIASRQSVGMIRLHVVDQSRFNPETVMPGYYRPPQQLHRVARNLRGRTWLTAQEIEDVVAYLTTLK